MENLTCSSHSFIFKPSPAKFHHSKQHFHFLIAPHTHLHSLHLSSTQHLKSTCWLASSHQWSKTLPSVSVGTHEQQTEETTRVAQVKDEASHRKHSELKTDGIPTEHDVALAKSTNAQLSINTDMQCDEATTVKDLPNSTEASQMEKPGNRHNVHAPNDCMLTHSEIIQAQNEEKTLKRKSQQLTYLFAALASSVGITSLAGASVYYRFAWQMEGGEVPWTEMFGTFSLALGAAVGMEYWARWAHRALWHASLWTMHESHHRPREGPFELNDVFAIINALPAIALMAFGFLHKGLVPGLCFGAGLGITIFGIAYMFVHDGLVHRRFPVGPIADVPYFQRVAAAHQLHHADRFNGVPYGLFLGPMELKEVGGQTELEKLVQKRKREKTNPIKG